MRNKYKAMAIAGLMSSTIGYAVSPLTPEEETAVTHVDAAAQRGNDISRDQSLTVADFVRAGYAEIKLGCYEDANKLLTIAVTKDPAQPSMVYASLGFARANLQLWADAESAYRTAFRDQNFPTELYLNYAWVEANLGKWTEAAQILGRAEALDARLRDNPYYQAQYLYDQLQDWRDVNEFYQPALQTANLPASFYVNLGYVNSKLHHWKDADTYYQRALQSDPNLGAKVYAEAAMVKLNLHEWRQARDLFEQAFKKMPSLKEMYQDAIDRIKAALS